MVKRLLLVILALGLLAGERQARADGPSSAKVKRMVYSVQNEDVKELAAALGEHFKNEKVQVLPVLGSGALFISGPPAVLDEVQQLLKTLDRPRQIILVQVLVAEILAEKAADGKKADPLDLSGPWDGAVAKVEELRRKGTVGSVKILRLTALENQVGSVQGMENKPYVVGTSGRRGGGMPSTSAISYRSTGTMLSVTPQILTGGKIALKIKIEDGRRSPSRAGVKLGEADKNEPILAMEFVTTVLDAKLIVAPGQAAGTDEELTDAKAGKARVVVLVTARIVPERAPK